MFFKFLKRNSEAPAPVKRRSRRRSRPDAPPTTGQTDMQALEVSEASDSSAWNLWKDSVAMIESQLSALQPKGKLHRRSESGEPTQPQDVGTFARVKKP